MQPLQWEHRPDGLRAPALICAFKGWNDAADAASSAIQFVGSALGAQRFATIDPEEFYDFQATRPRVKMVDGQAREIVWPAVELYEARVPRAARDLILLAGSEPSFRWRTFSKLVIELAEALGTQLVVTLGALLADVPHTRPVSVTGLSSDPALVARLGLAPSSYEGPTGIVGILHAACQQAGLPSASLWAAVPHYIAATPNPKAALALVRKLEGLVGVAVDGSELESAVRRLRAPGQRRRAERPRRAGVRRAPRAGGEQRGPATSRPRCRRARRSPATCSASCASAAPTARLVSRRASQPSRAQPLGRLDDHLAPLAEGEPDERRAPRPCRRRRRWSGSPPPRSAPAARRRTTPRRARRRR